MAKVLFAGRRHITALRIRVKGAVEYTSWIISVSYTSGRYVMQIMTVDIYSRIYAVASDDAGTDVDRTHTRGASTVARRKRSYQRECIDKASRR